MTTFVVHLQHTYLENHYYITLCEYVGNYWLESSSRLQTIMRSQSVKLIRQPYSSVSKATPLRFFLYSNIRNSHFFSAPKRRTWQVWKNYEFPMHSIRQTLYRRSHQIFLDRTCAPRSNKPSNNVQRKRFQNVVRNDFACYSIIALDFVWQMISFLMDS